MINESRERETDWSYINVDIVDGKDLNLRSALRFEAIEFPAETEPLDGVEGVIFQVEFAVEDDVSAGGHRGGAGHLVDEHATAAVAQHLDARMFSFITRHLSGCLTISKGVSLFLICRPSARGSPAMLEGFFGSQSRPRDSLGRFFCVTQSAMTIAVLIIDYVLRSGQRMR